MENPLIFGLGLTGTTGVVIGVFWLLIQKGLKSKCRIAGEVITLDIHKETPGDLTPPHVTQAEVLQKSTIPV